MSEPVVHEPEQPEPLVVGPTSVRFLARSEHTAGESSVEVLGVEPGFHGPPPHIHQRTSHCWFVVDGEMTLTVAGDAHSMSAGGFIYVPKGTSHTFGNHGSVHSRMIQMSVPGGLEKYLDELATAFPPGAEVDPAVVVEIMARHDTYPAGPPPG